MSKDTNRVVNSLDDALLMICLGCILVGKGRTISEKNLEGCALVEETGAKHMNYFQRESKLKNKGC
jgi:hypothetical protein